MRYVLVALALFSLFAPPASAQPANSTSRDTPALSLLASALEAATQVPERPNVTRRASSGMFWGGISMLAGGTTLAVLGGTALKDETCANIVYDDIWYGGRIDMCVEETNKPLVYSGLAAAGGGALLTALGSRRVYVSAQPGRITAGTKVRW